MLMLMTAVFVMGDLDLAVRGRTYREPEGPHSLVVRGRDLESALQHLASRTDCRALAVVGLPEERMGERVCAVVVPRAGAAVGLEDIRGFVANRLAAFKCPEALYKIAEVPRTPTGKTDKRALRAVLAAATGPMVARTW